MQQRIQQQSGAIMAVEDDPYQMELLALAVRSLPVHVPLLTAIDGVYAMRQLQQIPAAEFGMAIKMVLLDLRLPRMHGLRLLARAHALGLTEQAPFIVLTSADSTDERLQALHLGARDYLVKPLGYRALQLLVTQLYQRWIEPHGTD